MQIAEFLFCGKVLIQRCREISSRINLLMDAKDQIVTSIGLESLGAQGPFNLDSTERIYFLENGQSMFTTITARKNIHNLT